jgi:hypothetical protein
MGIGYPFGPAKWLPDILAESVPRAAYYVNQGALILLHIIQRD